jgi:equilibrative nucleoside transporter 1/2/3
MGENLHFNALVIDSVLMISFQPKNKPWLVIFMSITRAIFIPVLMFCNAQPRHHLPVYIHSDLYYILITIVFAISNGYLCNLAFILAPT